MMFVALCLIFLIFIMQVSEAILPAYQYDESQDGMNPSRLNPRMPNSKKGESSAADLDASYAELFDESQEGDDANKVSILSLINDTINRTPMDRIQADFPSTPSAVYSKRIFESAELKDGADGEGTSAGSNGGEQAGGQNAGGAQGSAAAGAGASPGSASDAANPLDQTTKAMDKLYVSPVSHLTTAVR
jgi:hypothetical protein